MGRVITSVALCAAVTALVSGCGGGGGYDDGEDGGGPASPVSYLGTTGVFAAWADPTSNAYAFAPIGSYAGKRQSLHGTVDFTTGIDLSQPAGIEVYKGSDGHIHALDLTSTDFPVSQQLSNETMATVDDACSLSGTQVSGANSDYAGVYFAADLQNPVNSTYFYRLPGSDGVCNSADDVVRMVKTGMSSQDTPITVSGMPIATVHTAQGGISGFVVKSGAQLLLVDSNFANPVVLGTFATAIGVASVLPVGTIQGYSSGQMFVVDGNIVYVNFASRTVSAPLFVIPNWTPTNAGAIYAASPSALYFSINTAATQTTPYSASIYSMPADGSALPTVVDAETGPIEGMSFPVGGTNLVWGVTSPTYTIRTMSQSGGTPTTLATSPVNAGTFVATATSVYYTTWANTFNTSTKVITRSSTASGIVGLNGVVIQAPLANSSFAGGGEQFPWPNDTTTTETPYETILQVQGLSPVTVTNATTGITYIVDGVSGGTVVAIDTATNQSVVTLGTVPAGTAMFLAGTFRDSGHSGFIEAYNTLSIADPATRDLYLLSSHDANSLTRLTDNL